jgi:putative tricarboxylic transport membrane protein
MLSTIVKSGRTAALAVLALGACLAAAHAQEGWQPTKNVELISGSAAGGGGDRQTRESARLLELHKLVPTTVTVVNKTGGADDNAVAYMNSHHGDPHYLVQVTNSWFTDGVLNNNLGKVDEVTPIFKLLTVTSHFYTRADNPLNSAQDVVAKLKEDPTSVTFAMGANPGSDNWLALMQFAKAAGVDPKQLRIGYNEAGSETIAQVLGGHVDVGIGGLSGSMPLIESGELKNIGLMIPERLKGENVAELKTLREQGIDAVANNWRAILGPKGMTAEQIQYWEDVFRKMVATEDFQNYAASIFSAPENMGADEFKEYLQADAPRLRALMDEVGVTQ